MDLESRGTHLLNRLHLALSSCVVDSHVDTSCEPRRSYDAARPALALVLMVQEELLARASLKRFARDLADLPSIGHSRLWCLLRRGWWLSAMFMAI